jgi:hypothetical protein
VAIWQIDWDLGLDFLRNALRKTETEEREEADRPWSAARYDTTMHSSSFNTGATAKQRDGVRTPKKNHLGGDPEGQRDNLLCSHCRFARNKPVSGPVGNTVLLGLMLENEAVISTP